MFFKDKGVFPIVPRLIVVESPNRRFCFREISTKKFCLFFPFFRSKNFSDKKYKNSKLEKNPFQNLSGKNWEIWKIRKDRQNPDNLEL